MARVFISHSSRDGEASAQFKSWLQGQGFDTPFLDFDKHSGITPGSDWEKTLYREIEQSEAMLVIQTPNWLESKWCFAEFTQARALGKPIFPVIMTPTGDQLISPDVQALDLQADVEGGLERLARELSQIALDAQGGFAWDATRSPYPGLLAFQEEDAALFFGRDDDIRRLIERLNARRAQGGSKLIALLGASGSGKSSLLRAGVIPRLRRSGHRWIILPPFRPRLRPVDEFAQAVAVMTGTGANWGAIRDYMHNADPAQLLDELARNLRMRAGANEAHILIPIDQAEELFGAADPDQTRRFFELLNAAMSEHLPFIAVMAQRSDYLEALQSCEHLTARFEEFSLGPLPLARIPQIIEGPARVAGLQIDEELVMLAARDAKTDDALPLLAFALRELYDRYGDDNHLATEDYRALGDPREGLTPLENAVRKAADDVLAQARPTDDQLAALRDAFVPAMVKINDRGEYARRPARWDELPAKAHPLLERLAKARLLIIRQDGDARMVDVAHEALLRKWPRLRSWLDEAREFLAGKQQLERDLREWQRAAEAEKAGALLTGLKLNRARGWMVDRPHQLTGPERAFVQASIDRAEAEERRKIRLRRNITRASMAATLVLAGVAGFAGFQWLEANKAVNEAKKAAEELVHAEKQRVAELSRYVWTDLGAKQEEVIRLAAVAERLGQERNILVPSIISKKQPDGFDCKTSLESGFRHLYCSVRSVINFKKIKSISGRSIFRTGGPHGDELNLSDHKSFGHYNPEFLDWLDDFVIPQGLDDPRFNQITRLVYTTHIGPTARALYNAHEILFADPEAYRAFEQRFQTVKTDYLQRLAKREVNESRFGGNPKSFAAIKAAYLKDLEQGALQQRAEAGQDIGEDFRWLSDYLATDRNDDWYLANTAGGFWIRRSIDGTEAQIFRLLIKLLRTFEPTILAENRSNATASLSDPAKAPR